MIVDSKIGLHLHFLTRVVRKECRHLYVEDPALLADGLQAGHSFVPELLAAASKMLGEIETRGWA